MFEGLVILQYDCRYYRQTTVPESIVAPTHSITDGTRLSGDFGLRAFNFYALAPSRYRVHVVVGSTMAADKSRFMTFPPRQHPVWRAVGPSRCTLIV